MEQQLLETQQSRFREAFESYASCVTPSLPGIEQYINLQRQITKTLEPLIQDGMSDGSFRDDMDLNEIILTIIRTFSSFGNSMALKSSLHYLEDEVESPIQQQMLKEMLLSYVRA